VSFVLANVFCQNLKIISVSQNQTLDVGQRAEIKVEHDGATTFQWYLDGEVIPSATEANYTSPILTKSNSLSQYYVKVSNDAGQTLMSETIIVEVGAVNSQLLTLSGSLRNYAGKLIKSDVVDMVVKIYGDLADGNALYEEAFLVTAGNGIKVSKGEFVVRLGEGVSSQNISKVIQSNQNLYAEFSIGSQLDVLVPRIPITSLPYSMSHSNSVLYGEGTPSIGLNSNIGSHYVDKISGNTWVKTQDKWVLLNQ
jgi:hypothetical protein